MTAIFKIVTGIYHYCNMSEATRPFVVNKCMYVCWPWKRVGGVAHSFNRSPAFVDMRLADTLVITTTTIIIIKATDADPEYTEDIIVTVHSVASSNRLCQLQRQTE